MKRKSLIAALLYVTMGFAVAAFGASYHVDSKTGSDANNGRSPQTAWETLKKASSVAYKRGDRILLKRGSIFRGKLELKGVMGSKDAPVIIDAYGIGETLPKIDSAGYIAGVAIEGCEYIEVMNLEVTSNGGKEIDARAKTDRYGIHVSKSRYVSLNRLYLHTLFATIQTKSEGKDKTTAYGHGVGLKECKDVAVEKCRIERVGRYGIQATKSQNIMVLDNKTDHTGCSGIQMSRSQDIVIRGNIVDHPGSFVDKRMHGRGSGSWMWSCENVLYEKNKFLNAKGKGDSCGVHIDFNCKNVVVQYCFSRNNEGGFVEILGNNHHCAYRYNISVNDGFRRKGKGGAHQEGKTLWLSGFCGKKSERSGPFNSYIYNNTIYVKKGARSCFSIGSVTKGALVANNIFHLLGPTVDVMGDQKRYKKKSTNAKAKGVVFVNNVYTHESILPASLRIVDSHPMIGDSGFKNPGGKQAKDYIPANAKLLKDKGIKITNIPGDNIGLTIGLEVTKDFFGNPIKGTPDIGAIEIKE
jgi:hypothetical protein